ncbi:TetR family transcriptional regulator [Frankia sp. CcI49]|uniref:TetR/AcrR family transcriptional regulator n=1 Tax=unclassified Frankia TaxID=2632575 RepID=UPI0006CA3A68|nr:MULTISPECIES: TetR/AcrR family transcriptional regulator [unclassified Frankia]KPM52111.1 TetR family transcriptional regulator [Frankia sp. R43]ONH49970.1 TetR family transcriptional regulator [Frankia sp. CcI49]
MRSDARRNRELIVSAALAVIAERGSFASMDEIARVAGLGVGTLYRHFPDRQALLDTITVDTLRELHAVGQRQGVGRPRSPELNELNERNGARAGAAWAALREVVDHCTHAPLTLIKTLNESASDEPEIARLLADVNEMLVGIVEAAQAEGTLRDDIASAEVVQVISVAVCRPGARPDDALTTVLMDGLRVRRPETEAGPAPAPAVALTSAEH